jgi:uncharacterized membrane protein
MRGPRVYAVAAGLGAVAGLRTMTAPAAVALAARRPPRFFRARATAAALTALAAGELAADKLPFMKSRTEPGSLAARAASGALCGAAVCAAHRKRPALGAVLGAAAAIGAAFAGYELRRRAGRSLGIPDPAVAIFEDALAAGAGWALAA